MMTVLLELLSGISKSVWHWSNSSFSIRSLKINFSGRRSRFMLVVAFNFHFSSSASLSLSEEPVRSMLANP